MTKVIALFLLDYIRVCIEYFASMDGLIFSVAGGLIAGVVILFAEYLIRRHEKRGDSVTQRIFKFSNEERRITGSIFNYLGPRSSVDLMRSELGPPNRKSKEVTGLFTGDVDADSPDETNSYLYFFKNAQVKICSKDGEVIDSLTVLANDTDISFSGIFFTDPDGKKQFLNVETVDHDLIEGCRVEEFPGCREYIRAAQKEIGNPFYMYITYFCDYSGEEETTKSTLIGSVISGVCLSSEPETVSYIYISECV